MKTTIDIADALLRDAKKAAARRETSLRALVEEGLREVLSRDTATQPGELRDASVGGGWLQPEFDGASWDRLADAAYEGRGT